MFDDTGILARATLFAKESAKSEKGHSPALKRHALATDLTRKLLIILSEQEMLLTSREVVWTTLLGLGGWSNLFSPFYH